MNNRTRSRRLRDNEKIRNLVRETSVNTSSLIYPIFIQEGKNIKEEIPSMEGQYRYSLDQLPFRLEELAIKGVQNIMLFGIPDHKDEIGSGAFHEEGIIQKTLLQSKETHPELFYIADLCMCEYTSHGHCGILKNGKVDNDTTLEYLEKIAVSQAEAGADMIAPSDMMDFRIGRIRDELDKRGFQNLPIMAYSAKYASSFYDPFRAAADSAPACGNRKSYQMDFHNRKEAIKEILQDISEGADIIMVKPALSYLDIIREAANEIHVPLAAYSVSGEYAMIKGASGTGYIDEDRIVAETTISIFRAGADILLTYYAEKIIDLIHKGWI
ncbi:porphobilinogen synthase [Gallicola sp. Sow4_E12]|uniref:porphobilinogen synthase n=1 Tax=Gallicola sp. Sow4_E12 TaxID=3438785 RepID=UPI003F91D47A